MKNRLFHPLPASPMREARKALSDLNDELRRAGLQTIKGGRSLASVRAATEEARKEVAAEQERKQKEEEAKKREAFDEYREKIRDAVEKAKSADSTAAAIRAIMSVLSSEDQAALRSYDSDDIVGIAEIYANADFDMDIHAAADEYNRQKGQAFDDMDAGNYDADFSGVPFF